MTGTVHRLLELAVPSPAPPLELADARATGLPPCRTAARAYGNAYKGAVTFADGSSAIAKFVPIAGSSFALAAVPYPTDKFGTSVNISVDGFASFAFGLSDLPA